MARWVQCSEYQRLLSRSHGGILARNVNQSSFSNCLIYKVLLPVVLLGRCCS